MSPRSQAYVFTLNLAAIGLSFVHITIVARALGDQLFGIYSFLNNQVLLVAPALALVPHLIFWIKNDRDLEEEDKNAIFETLQSLSFRIPLLLLIPLALAIATLSPLGIQAWPTSALAAVSALLPMPQNFFFSLMQIRDRFPLTVWIQVGGAGVRVITITALVFLGQKGVNAGLISVLAGATFIVLTCWSFRSNSASPQRHSHREGTALLRATLKRKVFPLLLPTSLLCIWLVALNSGDIFFARFYLNETDLSVYSLNSSVARLAMILPSVLIPLLLESGYRERLLPQTRSTRRSLLAYGITIALGFVLSCSLYLIGPFLAHTVFARLFDLNAVHLFSLSFSMTLLACASFVVNFKFGAGRRRSLYYSIACYAGFVMSLLAFP
ncbi:MAG: hypothetical protein AB7P49_16770, partial [Bdellovibrionales bacterium]